MNNLWLEFLVDRFVTEETDLRCCGSCQGGCLNPAICAFVCCGIPLEKLSEYYNENKDRLRQEFDVKMTCNGGE